MIIQLMTLMMIMTGARSVKKLQCLQQTVPMEICWWLSLPRMVPALLVTIIEGMRI